MNAPTTVDEDGRPIVLTISETASLMRCSDDSVYHLVASGKLRAFEVGKSGKRILASVVYAYMGADGSDRHLKSVAS